MNIGDTVEVIPLPNRIRWPNDNTRFTITKAWMCDNEIIFSDDSGLPWYPESRLRHVGVDIKKVALTPERQSAVRLAAEIMEWNSDHASGHLKAQSLANHAATLRAMLEDREVDTRMNFKKGDAEIIQEIINSFGNENNAVRLTKLEIDCLQRLQKMCLAIEEKKDL